MEETALAERSSPPVLAVSEMVSVTETPASARISRGPDTVRPFQVMVRVYGPGSRPSRRKSPAVPVTDDLVMFLERSLNGRSGDFGPCLVQHHSSPVRGQRGPGKQQ